MEVTAWLDPPRDDQLNKEMAAPCVDQPSDHFASAYEVEFKPKGTFPKFIKIGNVYPIEVAKNLKKVDGGEDGSAW